MDGQRLYYSTVQRPSWQSAKSTDAEPQTIIYSRAERYNVMTDLIVKSAVKDAVEGHPVAADFYEALNDEVDELLSEAAERAEANDRKTVDPRDL